MEKVDRNSEFLLGERRKAGRVLEIIFEVYKGEKEAVFLRTEQIVDNVFDKGTVAGIGIRRNDDNDKRALKYAEIALGCRNTEGRLQRYLRDLNLLKVGSKQVNVTYEVPAHIQGEDSRPRGEVFVRQPTMADVSGGTDPGRFWDATGYDEHGRSSENY